SSDVCSPISRACASIRAHRHSVAPVHARAALRQENLARRAVLARRERPWRLGYCGSSAGAEHGKPAALVRPMLYVAKARLGEQVAEFLGRVLIRVLGMNALAGGKAPLSRGPAYEHIALRLQEQDRKSTR